jgi:glyoxylase-like metal-dependent hydrolase (beta-lactamase superfamily II)
MQEIAPNIYVETGYPPVTVGAILTSRGWVCIDAPPYPDQARRWRTALKSIDPRPICFLINTDSHRDRILGNCWLEAAGIAHESIIRPLLETGDVFVASAAEELGTSEHEIAQIASAKLVPQQLSFSHMLHLTCGNRELELVNRPSAAPGSTWVLLRSEKVLFAGDSVVDNHHPFMSASTSKAWLDALRLLRSERYVGWQVVTGRGGVVSPGSTGQMSEYLRVARRRVSNLHHAGGARSEVGQFVAELLSHFPYESDDREKVQRRVRLALEAIYDEMLSGTADDDRSDPG